MTCTLTANVYDKSCLDCMIRKIKSLRSQDGALSRTLQLGAFAWTGEEMAEQVKARLRGQS